MITKLKKLVPICTIVVVALVLVLITINVVYAENEKEILKQVDAGLVK